MQKEKILGGRDTGLKPKSDLLKDLRGIYEILRKEMKENWNRGLPFEELLFDRWERARQLGFGEGSSIYHNSYVYGDVRVGNHTWIGPLTLLDGSGELTIGSYCSISVGVQIYTHDTIGWAISGGKKEYRRKATAIGSKCYIGPNTVISMGVTIGDGCIIGANSLVVNDVPSESKAYGTPCRIMGRADLDDF